MKDFSIIHRTRALVLHYSSCFIFLAILLMIAGCDKKEDPSPSKSSLLTANAWQMTAATVSPAIPKPGGGTTNDYYTEYLPACLKDNTTTYLTTGTLTIDEGPSKCNTNDPQTTTGTWVFNPEQTKITEVNTYGTFSSDILELTADTFKTKTEINILGTVYTVTATYRHP